MGLYDKMKGQRIGHRLEVLFNAVNRTYFKLFKCLKLKLLNFASFCRNMLVILNLLSCKSCS